MHVMMSHTLPWVRWYALLPTVRWDILPPASDISKSVVVFLVITGDLFKLGSYLATDGGPRTVT